tara:strand:+ start:216 stop:722 length:507 start_codon:yes stop_codon:yes gene_type:complete
MSDIRGVDPQGRPRDVAVDNSGGVFVAGKVFKSALIPIPGIGAGAGYAAGDAFGTKFIIHVPKEGTISNVVFLDHDDEGIQKELILFSEDFTATADNSAFAVSDDDIRSLVGVVDISWYINYNANQVGQGTPALSYVAPEGRLYAQLVTRGADNIAAGAVPDLFVVVV